MSLDFIHKNCDQKLSKDRKLPKDSFLVVYKDKDEIKYDITRSVSQVEIFNYYYDIRMLKILLLGAISGFHWVIIGSSLSLCLKEEGLSRSTIGWAGLIFAVYAFNYLWAPLIDKIRIPILTKKIESFLNISKLTHFSFKLFFYILF